MALSATSAADLERDDVEAHNWMLLAAEGGFEAAKQHCAIMAQRFTRSECIQAQRLVRALKAAVPNPDSLKPSK